MHLTLSTWNSICLGHSIMISISPLIQRLVLPSLFRCKDAWSHFAKVALTEDIVVGGTCDVNIAGGGLICAHAYASRRGAPYSFTSAARLSTQSEGASQTPSVKSGSSSDTLSRDERRAPKLPRKATADPSDFMTIFVDRGVEYAYSKLLESMAQREAVFVVGKGKEEIGRCMKVLAKASATLNNVGGGILAGCLTGLRRDTLDAQGRLELLKFWVYKVPKVPHELPKMESMPPSFYRRDSDASKTRNLMVATVASEGYRRFDVLGSSNLTGFLATLGSARLGLLNKDLDVAFVVKCEEVESRQQFDGKVSSVVNHFTFLLSRCEPKNPRILLPYSAKSPQSSVAQSTSPKQLQNNVLEGNESATAIASRNKRLFGSKA